MASSYAELRGSERRSVECVCSAFAAGDSIGAHSVELLVDLIVRLVILNELRHERAVRKRKELSVLEAQCGDGGGGGRRVKVRRGERERG